MALTVDIPLIRLADGDVWSIMLLRSGTTLVAVALIWLFLRMRPGGAPPLIQGRAGLVVAALYGASSICFVIAVFNTATADLVFILAFNAMFAAALGWLFLKERPRLPTLAAMVLMIAGVLVIVWGGIGAGNLVGNLFALASAFMIAAAITITRATGRNMGFAALVAVTGPMLVGAFMVFQNGLNVAAPLWVVFNGLVIMPVSFFCLANAPRWITGPEVAMFYLLETVLAPVWVWMIFAEVPTSASLAGGALLIATLIAHSLWQLSENRRRKAALAPRHPL